MYLPQLPRLWQSLNKFYGSILEIFQNKILRIIKAVDKHAIVFIGYNMQRKNDEVWKNAVSSHGGLIPFETVYEKRGGLLWSIARKKNLVSLRLAAFLPFLCVIWSMPTNFTIVCLQYHSILKKINNPEITPSERLKEPIVYSTVSFQGQFSMLRHFLSLPLLKSDFIFNFIRQFRLQTIYSSQAKKTDIGC